MKKAAALMLVFGLVAMGCATLGGNPARQVNDTVETWMDALLAKDVDALMETYSEEFTDTEYRDKTGLAQFMAQSKSMGYLDGLTIDRSSETVEVEGNAATAGPIKITGYFGMVTVDFSLAKEAGGWMIVEQRASGI